MEGKKSFTAYCDWTDIFENLSDEEAGQLVKHLFRYVNDQNPKAPNRIVQISFTSIQTTLKRDLQKWLKTLEANRANGLKGGRPRNPSKPKEPNGLIKNPSKPKKGDSDRVKVKDSDRVKVSDTNNNIYRSFGHLSINIEEVEKIKSFGYTNTQINNKLDEIENWKKNTNRSNLYRATLEFLRNDYPTVEDKEVIPANQRAKMLERKEQEGFA